MTTVLLLLGIAVSVALVVRRLAIPYTVALVIVGLALSDAGYQARIQLAPDLVLDVFLPVLLFEAALRVELRPLRDALPGILVLAVPGVLLSTAIVAVILRLGGALPLIAAALFGALISATDPVAVIALFREFRLPRPLTMLVEGESVLNDGTALALYGVLLPAALGGAMHVAASTAEFLLVVLGGLLVGGLLGLIAAEAERLSDDHLVELGISVVLAYASFLAAQQLQLSGVIACVCAGLVFGARRGAVLSSAAQSLLGDVWEFAAFLVNSILFLLIGLTVRASGLLANARVIALAILAALLARVAVVYGLGLLLRVARHPLVLRHRHLVFWSGLRGALSIALVLALPAAFVYRDQFLQMTLGVVLFTLLVQGLTLRPLLRWLRRADR